MNDLIDTNVEFVDKNKFNKFLREYIRKAKQLSSQRTPRSFKLPPPKPHPLHIPYRRKHITSSSLQNHASTCSSLHPMKLRYRHQRRSVGSPFKYLAAQHLFFNHVYNTKGTRQTIDQLLKLDPTIWSPSVSNKWCLRCAR